MSRVACVAALLVLTGRPAAEASTNLRLELAEVAKGLKQLVEGRGEDSIAVGQFTGPSHSAASSGPAISQMLTEELQKMGINVTRRAGLEVKGDYLDVEDKKTKQLAMMLKGRVLDRSGTVITEFERGVFGDATLASMFGLTVELPPAGDTKARDKALRGSIDAPKAHIAKTRISAGPDSPYAIEVLIKAADQYIPRLPKPGVGDDAGLAFAPIDREEIYAVRLINDSPHDAAVMLTIDGLNVFSFSDVRDPKTGLARYTQWIIPPKSHGDIVGWHRTNELTESFQVMEYAKSAAAELKSTAPVGTITASFAAAWPKGSPPPPDEPLQPPSEFARSAEATGRGPRITTSYTEAERNFGVVRASISVRYTK
jgi:hypothetical protein